MEGYNAASTAVNRKLHHPAQKAIASPRQEPAPNAARAQTIAPPFSGTMVPSSADMSAMGALHKNAATTIPNSAPPGPAEATSPSVPSGPPELAKYMIPTSVHNVNTPSLRSGNDPTVEESPSFSSYNQSSSAGSNSCSCSSIAGISSNSGVSSSPSSMVSRIRPPEGLGAVKDGRCHPCHSGLTDRTPPVGENSGNPETMCPRPCLGLAPASGSMLHFLFKSRNLKNESDAVSALVPFPPTSYKLRLTISSNVFSCEMLDPFVSCSALFRGIRECLCLYSTGSSAYQTANKFETQNAQW
mmetsp:Transcript_14269/g.20727  ORF Transcript_14269/g.20727 Transcript_14269/m.20727 type:complete len:300 (+) Transcript_14269:1547-2446(+)